MPPRVTVVFARPRDRAGSRLVWVLPGAFGALLLGTVLVAALAARLGSVHTPPGDGVGPVAWVLTVLYAGAVVLALGCRGEGGARVPWRWRLGLAGGLAAVALPLAWLVVAPGLNGLVATSAERTERLALVELVESRSSRSRTSNWWARLDGGGTSLPSGRYFVGRYGDGWQPKGALPRSGDPIEVRWRRGLFGARTVLEVRPVER